MGGRGFSSGGIWAADILDLCFDNLTLGDLFQSGMASVCINLSVLCEAFGVNERKGGMRMILLF